MIVRKYNRRSRSLTRSCSDSAFDDVVSDDYGNSLSQESPLDVYSFAFSSQDSSSHWSLESDLHGLNSSQESRKLEILPPKKPPIGGYFENDDENFRKSKKPRSVFDFEPYGSNSYQESRQLAILPPKKPLIGRDFEDDGVYRKSKKVMNGSKRESKLKGVISSGSVGPTATLMETQEFGEMIEHEDEVNFALDGLRKGQPVRIRRASLLSLLSICGTAQQRRLLRTQGMAKIIIDTVMGLNFDDSPSNLAAAALFYILTCDGQDEHFMDSPSCIRFLLKLLKPLTSNISKDKAPTIGSKLLSLRKDAYNPHESNGVNSTSASILHKVQEILVSCKQLKSRDGEDFGREKPELSPKWIALLAMEKACLSTISFEDTTGNVRKAGGNFKEKFREHGGLDAVFEIARNCHSNMERWLEELSSSIPESKDNVNLESLVLLLKCLKVMENATFLSQDNQSHLLGMRSNSQLSPPSFTKLMLSVIKSLSGVSLLRSSLSSSENEKFYGASNEIRYASERPLTADKKEDSHESISINSSTECCSTQWTSSQKSSNVSQNSHWLASTQLRVFSFTSETTTTRPTDTLLLKIRDSSSTPRSCNRISSDSHTESRVNNNSSLINFGADKTSRVVEDTKFELLVDSQDPFAFHEDEFELSKWDLLSGRQKVSQIMKNKAAVGEVESRCQSLLASGQQESSSMESQSSHLVSCSSVVETEKSNLLSDCLLTAVKVLMNLTNDNSVGCQQIAACGGLETLSSLIAGHFPSFSSFLPPFIELQKVNLLSKPGHEFGHQNDRHLTDEELDFLVAILGLLVNLVEKDGRNRSRLAATSVSFPSSKGSEDESRDVVPLLCSIFLSNQGAGEAAEEGKHLSSDDEDVLLQGEKEAEKMIVEAYAALLLAFLSTESKSIRNAISECLPDRNLAILVPVLERFVEFHLTLNMISPETHKTVLEVIESCRIP